MAVVDHVASPIDVTTTMNAATKAAMSAIVLMHTEYFASGYVNK